MQTIDINKKLCYIISIVLVYADVAELVDAPDSKSKWIFLIQNLESIDKYTGLGFGRI